MSFKLLISARDAAAAKHLIAVARTARSHPDVSVSIVTQDPAARYFAAAGIQTDKLDNISCKSADSEEAETLLQTARDVLSQYRPDAILCGLSTPFDAGIDEALTAAFGGPRFVMQDFWGEANMVLGHSADLYFALDEEAVKISKERHGVEAISVGSPYHAAYKALDCDAIRLAERERIGIPPDSTVLGFFGQALHNLAGYKHTLYAWLDAVGNQPSPCIALYRPHPRESHKEAQWTQAMFEKCGLRYIVADGPDVEHALLTCDVVCSAFSNCTYDAAYLNYFSSKPLITPLSLLFDEEIVAYFRKMVRLKELPYLKASLAKPVHDVKKLKDELDRAHKMAEKERYWQNAQRLHNPVNVPERILDEIRSRLPVGS
ncbi:hypothetical protein [Hwanghaeella sp.]|uniref:hypothetical protein n=1 Tax=Hwanghaeella sp. TaxID=2605943 RepID=UPI003CCBFE93